MKKIILSISISLNFFCGYLSAQESEMALKEYFADAEFFLAQEYYVDALSDYLQVMKRGYADNANLNYRVGVCYLNIPGQKEKSIQYLEKSKPSVSSKYKESSLSEKYSPIDVYLYLGNAYRVNEMLDKALEAYNAYKLLLPEDQKELHQFTDIQIEACKMATEFMKNPITVEFKNLGSEINSSSDDFRGVISGDGQTIVYMHKLPFYQAVYFSTKNGDKWSKPENITPQIMSDGDQYVNSLSYDGKLLFLNKEDEFNSDIYLSQFVDNRWNKSEPLGDAINTKFWESHASISKDGKMLFFTSNRKGGIGNMDIYVATLDVEGKYSKVANLGLQINTDLNEDTPFITEDGNTLYFSSQSYTSMGGYDIFVSRKSDSLNWGVPENIGYPVNSTDDDLFFVPSAIGGYMTRIADDTYGGLDIYEVDLKKPIIIKEELAQTITVTEPVDEPNNDVSVPVIVPVVNVETQKTDIKPEVSQPHVSINPETFELSPILFEFDKAALSEIGKAELDKLAVIIKANKAINVELIGYADALGPDNYNLRLSESRAKISVQYLINKGIEAKQLTATGKGETNFIAINNNPDGSDNAEGRKYNRRVEIEIHGLDNNKLIIKRTDPVPGNLQLQKK